MKDQKVGNESSRGFIELPEEIHLLLLSYLPFKDLINFRGVNTYFKWFIDKNDTLWANGRLHTLWPTDKNFPHMERASNNGNIEAAVKLGLQHLYKDMFGRCKSTTSTLAANHFLNADCAVANGCPPFTWIFYRPPWFTAVGKCRKVRLALAIARNLHSTERKFTRQAAYCYAQSLAYTKNDADANESAWTFKVAESLGCPNSTLKMMKLDSSEEMRGNGDLAYLRKLRNLALAHPNCTEVRIELCGCYMEGHYAGLDVESIKTFTQNIFQSVPNNVAAKCDWRPRRYSRSISVLSPTQRFILVDWLTEVIALKDYGIGISILHVVVQIIDRYLKFEKVKSLNFQLLGVTALVLATRNFQEEFLPIREAAWLTDNSYRYEDVVKMMGHVAGTLKGKLVVLTSDDYLKLLARSVRTTKLESSLAEYFTKVALLHSEFGNFSYSETASAAFVLARIVNKQTVEVWPESLVRYTGFNLDNLVEPILLLYLKCYFVEKGSVIKSIYGSEEYHRASSLQGPCLIQLLDTMNLKSEKGLHKSFRAILWEIGKLTVKHSTKSVSEEVNSILGACWMALGVRIKFVTKGQIPRDYGTMFCRCEYPKSRAAVKEDETVQLRSKASGESSKPLGEINNLQSWQRVSIGKPSRKLENPKDSNVRSKFQKLDHI